jgi:hypothetical protein
MLKSRISMLVAGALLTAQAGAMADVWQPDAASLDVISPSQQIAVFSPDGLTYAVVPAEQLMVFEPDGLIVSYDIAPALESSYVVLSDQYAAPELLTAFNPNGSSYELAPNGLVLSEPLDVVAYLTAADVYKMAETYVASYISPPTYETLIE